MSKKPRKPKKIDPGNYSLARSSHSEGFYKYPNELQIAWHKMNGTWPAEVSMHPGNTKHGYLFMKDMTRLLKHAEKQRA